MSDRPEVPAGHHPARFSERAAIACPAVAAVKGALKKMANKDEVRQEYSRKDLGAGTRGKYYDDYREGTNIVILDPDLAKAFPDSKSVNQALREYLQQRSC